MEAATELIGQLVCVVTLEGRNIVGTLRGIDGVWNLILENAHERLFSRDGGMERDPLGLYVVRGDSLCVGSRVQADHATRGTAGLTRLNPILPTRVHTQWTHWSR